MDLKSKLLELFVQYVVPPMFAGLGLGLSWVMMHAGTWLKAKATESKIAAAGVKVLSFVEAGVYHVETELKPLVLEAAKDGVITDEEGAKLKMAAINAAKEFAGKQGISDFKSAFGIPDDGVLDKFLGGIVEKVVAGMPKAADPVPT